MIAVIIIITRERVAAMVRLVVLDMAIVLARIMLVAGLAIYCDTTKPLPACVGIAAVISSSRKKVLSAP